MNAIPSHYIIRPDLDGKIDGVIAWMAERYGCLCRWDEANEYILLICRGDIVLGQVLAERFAGWQDSDEGWDLLSSLVRRVCVPQTKGSAS